MSFTSTSRYTRPGFVQNGCRFFFVGRIALGLEQTIGVHSEKRQGTDTSDKFRHVLSLVFRLRVVVP
jgi:hypothetical protein